MCFDEPISATKRDITVRFFAKNTRCLGLAFPKKSQPADSNSDCEKSQSCVDFFQNLLFSANFFFVDPVNLPVTVKNSANNLAECPAMLITQFPKDSLRFQKLTSHEIFKKIGKSYFYAFSRGQNITFLSLAQVGDMLFRCGLEQTLSTQRALFTHKISRPDFCNSLRTPSKCEFFRPSLK